jgi:hypothetical protein
MVVIKSLGSNVYWVYRFPVFGSRPTPEMMARKQMSYEDGEAMKGMRSGRQETYPPESLQSECCPFIFLCAANAHRNPRVTFRQVLLCREKPVATYIKPGNALSLRIEDIGRRRLLTQPRLSRQLPVVSAFRVSEG